MPQIRPATLSLEEIEVDLLMEGIARIQGRMSYRFARENQRASVYRKVRV